MRIGIDIREVSLLSRSKVGWYQYTYNLVANLLAIDAQNEYRLLSMLCRGKGFGGDERIPTASVRRLPGKLTGVLLERLSLPIECLLGPLDVFHGPCDFLPRSLRSRRILTLHDLMALRRQEFIDPGWIASLRKRVCAAAKQADAIIAVSEFTKAEIVELLDIPPKRIRVIHNGIAPVYRQVGDPGRVEQVKAKYGIARPYVLFVGNIEPKKNIEALIRAFAALRNGSTSSLSVVVAGHKDWHFPAIQVVVRECRAERDVVFTGPVDGDDLPLLYQGAVLFVFPSLFEGFGIPVIEAMARGVPVVASDRTSIPEVAGDAAMLVDPLDVAQMADAMRRLVSDTALRNEYIRRGHQRAEAFSWEKAARETLQLYQDVR
ncbi:MAG TPA: glycosyltransferase family 1 protein [Candidatus Methylomirabilis sp.]|nr:glycosyltransferase family 1 protein [Candidatus Methylomirabilis sp.]